jgi:polyphenol oxidase
MTLPPVPAAFRWTDEPWGAALRCVPLEAVAPHLFTSRQLDLSDAADVRRMAQSLGVDNAVLMTQVHGRDVVVVRDRVPPPRGRPEADVLVSDAADVAIAVRAADCVPLLMADAKNGVVAAVHAGWRGTAAKAAIAAVDALAREFASSPADLIVAIGPSIGSCCYEVGPELVDAFAAAGHERYLVERWFLAPPPRRGTHDRPRMRLDVTGANRDQLILAGVREENIHIAGLCTAEHLDVLTSYRAEREKAGRIAGAIRVAG